MAVETIQGTQTLTRDSFRSNNGFLDGSDNLPLAGEFPIQNQVGLNPQETGGLETPTLRISEHRSTGRRAIVLSKSLPVTYKYNAEGELTQTKSGGGLVTALSPILQNGEFDGGLWIGHPGEGINGDHVEAFSESTTFDDKGKIKLLPVGVDTEVFRKFYYGESNRKWMVYHKGLLKYAPPSDPSEVDAYDTVNHAFAISAAREARPGDPIIINDYQLERVAWHMRYSPDVTSEFGFENPGPFIFFLHTEFPTLDRFSHDSDPSMTVNAYLANDVIGFQSHQNKDNFMDAVRAYGIYNEIIDTEDGIIVRIGDRKVVVNAYPISISTDEFEGNAKDPEAVAFADSLAAQTPEDVITIYGGSRGGEPAKAVPQVTDGLELALDIDRSLRKRVKYRRVLQANRMGNPVYAAEMARSIRRADEVNERHGLKDSHDIWVRKPIDLIPHGVNRMETVGAYLWADGLEALSQADGMNLTPLEALAATKGRKKPLVPMVGENTGARFFLEPYAIIADPTDVIQTANAFIRMLTMSDEEREVISNGARMAVYRHNVYDWMEELLGSKRSINSVFNNNS